MDDTELQHMDFSVLVEHVLLIFMAYLIRLRKNEEGVIYTETDCIPGLPMFRGDLAVKTTYRVTPSEDDPDNSVRVKVCAQMLDLRLLLFYMFWGGGLSTFCCTGN